MFWMLDAAGAHKVPQYKDVVRPMIETAKGVGVAKQRWMSFYSFLLPPESKRYAEIQTFRFTALITISQGQSPSNRGALGCRCLQSVRKLFNLLLYRGMRSDGGIVPLR
jgi:hypothetical protein